MEKNKPITLNKNFWDYTGDMCPNCKQKAFTLPIIVEKKIFLGLFYTIKFEYTCKQCGYIWQK